MLQKISRFTGFGTSDTEDAELKKSRIQKRQNLYVMVTTTACHYTNSLAAPKRIATGNITSKATVQDLTVKSYGFIESSYNTGTCQN